MARNAQLADKTALVTGDNEIAEAIRAALTAEGATVMNEQHGPADVLVNAAAPLHNPQTTPVDISGADWQKDFDVCFEAPRRLTHALLPAMIEKKFGRIINLIGAFEPMHFNQEFAAWGALTAWGKSLTREVGRYGITVNAIQPGLIDCKEMHANHAPQDNIPAGHLGTTADIANLVVFLSSPYARYLSGIIIPVDGGMSRHQR